MIALYNLKIPSTSIAEMRHAAWVRNASAIIEAVRVIGGNKISATAARPIQYFPQPFSPESSRRARV
jgi:hypothetical protein